MLRTRPRVPPPLDAATSAQSLELDAVEVTSSPEPPAEEALAAPEQPAAGAAAPATPAALPAAAAPALATADEGSTPAESDSAAPMGSAAVAAAQPSRPIDLGLDGRLFLLPSQGTGERAPAPVSTAPLGPRAPHSDIQRQLQASLAADDVKRGMARGNALLGSLDSAARAQGPVRGEALVRVTVGADGSLLGVELSSGSAAEWGDAMRSFRELATRKRLRMPPGAKGMRVTFSVKAKVQRPSGKEVEASGVGVDQPSLKPGGLNLKGDFDLADLGGGAQRLVYARVVSEEVL